MQQLESGISAETWATRSTHWALEASRPEKRKKRQRTSRPLVLAGHGVSLRVDGGTLLIRNGRTHYPQEPETYRFYPGGLDVPPRIIMLDGSGAVSFDVLAWLSEQRVPLIHLDWRGEVVTVAGGSGYAADQKNVRWQIETRGCPKRRLEFCRALIRQKLEASIPTLRSVASDSPARDRALAAAEIAMKQLDTASTLDAVRGAEAYAASAYFGAWQGIELAIKGTMRRPVPDHWRRFGSRTSLANGAKAKNVRASDPLNAMLNYAYGVLQAQMQVRALSRGFDPTLGIMHHSIRGTPAYVFDIMEPERPRVDAAVLEFVAAHQFSAADFTLRSDGVVRLSPQLARAVVGMTSRTVAG